jgi:LysM repeat protein
MIAARRLLTLGVLALLYLASAQEIVVKSGDTLWSIAQRHDTTVAALKAANGLTSDKITPNQVLRLPESATAGSAGYTVQAGDTLYSISRTFDTTVDEIIAINKLDGSTIRVGQVLQLERDAAAATPDNEEVVMVQPLDLSDDDIEEPRDDEPRHLAQEQSDLALPATTLPQQPDYHTFPLDVRVSTLLDSYMLPGNLAGEAVETLELEVSGRGKLWEEDPGSLQLRLGTRPDSDGRRNFIEYQHPNIRLRLGDQGFALSTLVGGGSGSGLDVQGTLRLEPELSVSTRAFGYTSASGGRFGMSMSAVLLSRAEASAHVLIDPGGNTLWGGRLRFFPEIEGPRAFNLDLEYGRQLSDTAAHNALNFSASLEGSESLKIEYRQTEAGYGGAGHGSSRLNVEGGLKLSDEPEVNANLRLREEARHATDGASTPERYSLRLGGTFSERREGISASLSYDNHNEVRNDLGTSRQSNRVSFGVGLSLTDEIDLHQSLGWQREQRSEEFVPRDTLLYSVETSLPILEGILSSYVALGYELQEGALGGLEFGVNWFGLITDELSLYLDSGFDPVEDGFFYLSAGGFYQFEQKQVLDFDASLFLFPTYELDPAYEPVLQFSLGYNLSLDVPLGRSSTQRD